MSGLFTDGMRSNMPMPLYMPQRQYGVDSIASLVNLIPYVGPFIGAGMNMISQSMQNSQQEELYNKYLSPSARMSQMAIAGINPNLAAQGIAGAASPQMQAAAPTGAFTGIGEQLGGSVNSMLNADLIRASIDNTNADSRLKNTEARSIGIENTFQLQTFDERASILKYQNKWNEYTVEQLRPYAENSDLWYKVNFDNLDETVKKVREEIKQIDEQIELIKKQEDVAFSEVEKNYATADEARSVAALNNQKKQIIDDLGGDDIETAYVRARVLGDDKKADTIKNGVETYNKSVAESTSSGTAAGSTNTPQGRIKQMYEEDMMHALEFWNQQIKEKSATFGPNHNEVRKLRNQRDRVMRRYRNMMRRVDKGFAAGANIAGYGLNAGG